MVIAAVDDLLFSSKIRAVARQVGVEVVFARSRDAVIEQVRSSRPALVILDLDAERLAPLEVLAQLEADADLAGARTIGFVSHVHTGLMAAARAAGADQVLPRSAFVASLPDILAGGR
jgi:DNA-binding NarL/FixJ family response regulator